MRHIQRSEQERKIRNILWFWFYYILNDCYVITHLFESLISFVEIFVSVSMTAIVWFPFSRFSSGFFIFTIPSNPSNSLLWRLTETKKRWYRKCKQVQKPIIIHICLKLWLMFEHKKPKVIIKYNFVVVHVQFNRFNNRRVICEGMKLLCLYVKQSSLVKVTVIFLAVVFFTFLYDYLVAFILMTLKTLKISLWKLHHLHVRQAEMRDTIYIYTKGKRETR